MLQNKEFPAKREILPQMLTEISDRCKELLAGEAWNHPKKFSECNMENYGAPACLGFLRSGYGYGL